MNDNNDNTALYWGELAKNVHHNSFVGDKKPNVCVRTA